MDYAKIKQEYDSHVANVVNIKKAITDYQNQLALEEGFVMSLLPLVARHYIEMDKSK